MDCKTQVGLGGWVGFGWGGEKSAKGKTEKEKSGLLISLSLLSLDNFRFKTIARTLARSLANKKSICCRDIGKAKHEKNECGVRAKVSVIKKSLSLVS